MITVIIAGGSGTRLWPLSTPENPKQLLTLTSDRSMVQQAYDRAVSLGDTVYVVSEISHSDALRAQLPELPDEAFLIEPGRRGTAHCIIFALDYIARNHSNDEPVAFIHSDHNVRDIKGFAHSFGVAAEASTSLNRITLIGIEPTFPATGFGYIHRGNQLESSLFDVQAFKEKPAYDIANSYVESGEYYWNCGYFVGSVSTFVNEMERSAPELLKNYTLLSNIETHASEEYNQKYLELDNQVIDVALIEKAQELAVVGASFDWMDIGNFKDLHDVVSKDEQGNYAKGNTHLIESENVYVRSENERPVAIIGLDNVVVVDTPDGLLVARKDVAAKCGDVAKKLQK